MPQLLEEPMSKKKAGKPGPKPVDGGRIASTLIRSTEGWREWLDGLAEFDAKQRRAKPNISETIDRMAVLYARSIGYEKIPPPR